MNTNRLLELVGAPLACLFLILVICLFAIQSPMPTGIMIPTMHTRGEPLSNCEFNGFTMYLYPDGRLAGGSPDDLVSRDVMLSRVAGAQDNIQDDTFYLIADPHVPYGEVVDLVADIHRTAPADRIALVTPAGQVEGINGNGAKLGPYVDRCRYVWPAVAGQPKPHAPQPIPLPGDRISIWQALTGNGK
jgi:biopolymer transport protein ExbD